MSEHTPGPWHSWNKGGDGTDPYTWEIAGPMHTENHVVIADKVTEANARLIAAAPELLKALHLVCEALVEAGELLANQDASLWRQTRMKALIYTEEAINKAEGRDE